MRDFTVTPSKIFTAGCLAFLAGVFVATGNRVPAYALWALFTFGAIFIFAGLHRRAPFGSALYLPFGVGVVVLAFTFGMIRVQQSISELGKQTVVEFANERTTFIGEVMGYPETGLDKTRFMMRVADKKGNILVTADRLMAPDRGSVVEVVGVVRKPEPFDGFNYPMFLAKDGITATARASSVKMASSNSGSSASVARMWLGNIRSIIDRTAVSILPYKEGAILKAVLIGDEGSMTDSFKESLNASGLRHIVAVSGMNIAIILGLIASAMTMFGRSRRSAFWVGLTVVTIFIFLIGAPASAVRAGIMGLTLVAAPLLGRRGSGVRVAIATSAVMVALSPLTLVYDVGFQLSFLAVFGIITLTPLTGRPFRKMPKLLAETLSMTFAAQLAVLPLLFFIFGRISLMAPLSNLIVVPAISIVTVWGFVAVLAGALLIPLGQIIALPLLPYFSLVAWVAEVFGNLPAAEFGIGGIWAILLSCIWYVALMLSARYAQERSVRPIDLVPLYEGVHA